MRNEVAFRISDPDADEVEYVVTITGGNATKVLDGTKMFGIIYDCLEALSLGENTREQGIADTLFQLLDAQIRREYNIQAVMLKQIEVIYRDEGVSIYAMR